ncbi:hypothetical protein HPB48_007627 [Haemaphysalis longicornis]|uniref:Uncharacterized protein n=1 Tax=Haemaphysalis longicornis TaxID=44386 RepID=A0A9J6G5C7_HAELO|nr:hypothetical protein HPB48_007627 [Haemaphysalis longicornis]
MHEKEWERLDVSSVSSSIPDRIFPKSVALGAPSPARSLCTTCLLRKAEDRKAMMASLPKKDEGTLGERLVDVDPSHTTWSMFPDEDTPNLLFDGVRFQDLPICHIKCSLNNTLMTLTDSSGVSMLSCYFLTPCVCRHWCVCLKEVFSLFLFQGTEGYRNARKGTTVAAQAAALSFCHAAQLREIKTIRVIVKGLGPGRLRRLGCEPLAPYARLMFKKSRYPGDHAVRTTSRRIDGGEAVLNMAATIVRATKFADPTMMASVAYGAILATAAPKVF